MSDYYNRYGEMENDVDSFENVVIEEEKKPFDINIVLIPVFCTIVFAFVEVMISFFVVVLALFYALFFCASSFR